ncbi:MAG: ferrous iron transporter B [Myxococcota bacterium]|nr:ferrous iron transporter B [Myxococcota bacterium]
MDVARSRGIGIDAGALSQRLGVPVVPMCANRREGIAELRGAILDAFEGEHQQSPAVPFFPETLERQVEVLRGSASSMGADGNRRLSRVEAFRALVDEGGYTEERLVAEKGEELSGELARRRGEIGVSAPLSSIETEVRYSWINRILDGCLSQATEPRRTVSDKIDMLFTHSVAGMVIFIAVSALVFQGIYQWSEPLMGGIESLFSGLGSLARAILPAGALRSLVIDGIIGGVGGVILFLPQIAILFLFISVLEDCGYMSRAAFLMDRLLSRCGLSGTSFIPLLSSFACAVPGIMAARTIGDRRDRISTILVAPLMSCSARLPVYVLFIAAFIPDRPVIGGWLGLQALTLLAMYSVGTILAVPVAWILKSTLLRGETPPFLLELPTYKWPDPATVALRVYHSGRAFVVRAGSIILAATVVMWALAYFPRSQDVIDLHQEARSRLAQQSLPGDAYGNALHQRPRRSVRVAGEQLSRAGGAPDRACGETPGLGLAPRHGRHSLLSSQRSRDLRLGHHLQHG